MNCAKTYPVLYSALFIGAAVLISLISSRECIRKIFTSNRSHPLLSVALVDVSFNGVKDVALNETCAFCMEEFVEGDRVVSLSCKHIYHPRVIRAWLSTSQSCPLCRNPVENLWCLAYSKKNLFGRSRPNILLISLCLIRVGQTSFGVGENDANVVGGGVVNDRAP